jgi:dTDP-glucose pyrophosphorylase
MEGGCPFGGGERGPYLRYHGLLLAAGKGKRLGPGAEGVPKALVKVGRETLLEHNLARLFDLGLEHVVVVVGYLADRVVEHLAGHAFRDRIEFVVQEDSLGTGHAVSVSRNALRSEPFVLCYCDNFTPYRLEPLVRTHERGKNAVTFAVYHAGDPRNHGIMQVEGERVVDIVERPTEPIGDLAFAGMGVFESDVYDAVEGVRPSKGGEYYLTDAVMDLVRAGRRVGFDVLECMRLNINSPVELERAWAWVLAHPETFPPGK